MLDYPVWPILDVLTKYNTTFTSFVLDLPSKNEPKRTEQLIKISIALKNLSFLRVVSYHILFMMYTR